VGPNGVSKEVAAAAVDHVLSQGDYRLAKHACAALLRFRGNSLLSVGTSSKAIMAAAAAEEASAAASASTAAAAKKGSTSAAAVQKAKEVEAEKASASKARSENVDSIVLSLCDLIGGEWDGGGDLHNVHYYAAAQQALDAIFCLASNPAAICADILREMAARALVVNPREKSTTTSDAASISSPSFEYTFTSSVSRSRLSRFFFVLGHVPLKTLVHVEALSTRAKLLRIRASEKADHSNQAPPVNAAAVGGGGGKKGKASASAASSAAAGPKDDIEAQLGSAAAEDEKEAELVASIAEKELLSTQSLCGLFAPLLEHVTRALLQPQDADAMTPENETLAQSALLALCKLSAVSSDFCEKQLPLLFTILSRAHNPRIRALTVIALGDLAFRFPNMVEPYTSHLYARLRDADTRVRKNTLMVLTHLILNDMVKVKGQVGEIAVCLSDPDQRISDLTRVFFTELSKRSSNPIYNILPDTLSCLSRLASGEAQNQEFAAAIVADAAGVTGGPSPVALRQLDRETFREIVRFLLSFIGKDKQSDSLAEKLLHRFESTAAGGGGEGGGEKQEPTQQTQKSTSDSSALAGSPFVAALWRDLAFCLSQLPLSEKSIRRMAESVRTYKTALALPDVWESFLLMLNKAKKMVSVSSSAAASAAAKDVAEGGGGSSAPTTTTNSSGGGGGGASKVEMRQLVEEWEKALLEARSGAAEDDSALMNAKVAAKRARRVAEKEGVDSDKIASQALVAAKDAAAAVAAAVAPSKSKTTSAKAAAAAAAKVSAGLSSKESVPPPPPPPSSRPARKGAARKGIVIDDDDDDDDEEEEEVVKPTTSKSRGASRATTPNEGGGRKK